MQRIPVESSDIVSVGYEPKTKLLEIEFQGGRIYRYRDVDPETHEQFMRADSQGQYFNTFINMRHRYERVDEAKHAAPAALAFVTHNVRKVRDLQIACAPFDLQIEQLELPIDEIQSVDATEIAIKKAKQAYRVAQRPLVVSDIFWNILALRGFPGAYMNEVTRWLKAEDFLNLMKDKPDRTVTCSDTLVYYDGKRTKIFTQNIWGTIADVPRGKSGQAIDKLIIVRGFTQTVAEREDAEGRSSFDPHASNLADFAKWFNMQRRLGLVQA